MARPRVVEAAAAGALPVEARAWQGATAVVIGMIAIIAARLHELVPFAHLMQPALLATFGGLGLIWLRSTHAARAVLPRHPLVRVVLAYWLLMVVTVPFAMWPGLAFDTVRGFLPGAALVMAILLCAPTRRTLLSLQLGLVACVSVYALYARVLGRVGMEGRVSAGVGMYDSNDMAAMLALTLPIAIGNLRVTRGWQRTALAVAAGLLALMVVASGSRGGLLGMTAGGVVLALGMRGRQRVVAITLLVVALGGLWTFSSGFRGRLMTLTNLEADYNTFDEYGRKEVWKRGRQYIRDHPVIGVGAGNFPIAEGEYFGLTYGGVRGGKWSNAHNAYIQAFAELGFIGGTLFLSMLLYGFHRALRLWRGIRLRGGGRLHRPELLAGLSAFLVSGTFLSHAYYMPLMALLGLIALADRQQRLEQESLARSWAYGPAAAGAPEGGVNVAAVPGHRFRGGLA